MACYEIRCFYPDCWDKDGCGLLKEAREALARQAARKDEDVEAWAQKLGADLAKFTD